MTMFNPYTTSPTSPYMQNPYLNATNSMRTPYPPYASIPTDPRPSYGFTTNTVQQFTTLNPYLHASQVDPRLRYAVDPRVQIPRGGGWSSGWGDNPVVPQYANVYNTPIKKDPPPPVTIPPVVIPKPRPVVAANEHSSYWGDPHVADADRSDKGNQRQDNFVVKGEGIFQLLKDTNIAVNAEHKKYDQWGIEVTDKVGIALGNVGITFSAYGGPMVNGKPLGSGEVVTLSDSTQVRFDGNKLTVRTGETGEYNLDVSIVTSEHKNADGSPVKYLDTDISTKSKGVNSDGVLPSGILGEGFDEDNEARSGLKKDISTYKKASLLDV
ncbi:MAG: hypothetical protein HEQ32_05745 [Vampirovibrio sp.]